MGVNYDQRAILGICISSESAEHELSPAEYVEQPQYDTSTGVQVASKSVLKKHREVEYRYGKWVSYDMYSLGELIAKELHLSCVFDNDEEDIFIGFPVGETHDYGRVELLEGEVSLDELENLRAELQERLSGDHEINLYLITSVG